MDDEVAVWMIPLADRTDQSEMLAPDERIRADRLRERERGRFVAAHAGLRAVLGAALGQPPGLLKLVARADGKPVLAGGELRFNLSHSDDLALVAVGRREVGVDVERLRPLPDLASLEEECLAPVERVAVAALPASERERAFFRRWTCKEAWLKAVGVGLDRPLCSFLVAIGPEAVSLCVPDEPDEASRWSLSFLALGELDDRYVAALAVEGRAPRVEVRQWRW